jgi:hypothetical protein
MLAVSLVRKMLAGGISAVAIKLITARTAM